MVIYIFFQIGDKLGHLHVITEIHCVRVLPFKSNAWRHSLKRFEGRSYLGGNGEKGCCNEFFIAIPQVVTIATHGADCVPHDPTPTLLKAKLSADPGFYFLSLKSINP